MSTTCIRILPYSFSDLIKTAKIITACGNDMYKKYGLSHWKNSLFKNLLIVYYTLFFKHTKIWGVYLNGFMVATFQTRISGQSLYFCKFAVNPDHSGHGIGGQCINTMIEIAKNNNLMTLSCEVFRENLHALSFYQKRGFKNIGERTTLKYTEYALVKQI